MAEVPEQLRSALRGRYDLQRELGRGGMASVYLAHDLRYDRSVAIKVLSEPLAASVGRARFLLEIRIAARLSHPHILPLLDSGEAGDLLYYVMPYVEGESLKDRIEREKQLPIREAIAIAREVAAGLGHAHSQGIVHRDVKPGNILLSGGSAVIADFGIARAVRRSATDDTLTDVNLAIGTPAYMSPEQWSGTRELDQRSDIYSLGCVVYEMLAGQPPFTGKTTEAIAARVALDPVPPIRTVRPKVSAALERVILRALEKVPADRHATVAEFAEALAGAPLEEPGPEPTPPSPVRRWALAATGGVAVAATLWFLVRPLIAAGRVAPDTTLYAILPFKYEQGTSPANEDQALRDALSRWSGITLVDPFQVRDAVGRSGGGDLSPAQALGVARRVRAGRYVRAEVSRAGDSLRIRGFVYDRSQRGAKLDDAAVTVRADRWGIEGSFAALAESLLFRGAEPPRRREATIGTSSVPARQAYARGHRAVEEWDLDAADSAFSQATHYDPQYAQAFLWLAQVRAWSVAPPVRRRSSAAWRSAAERATAGRHRLSAQERMISEALVALARSEYPRACARWRELSRTDSLDFVTWYGLGSCLTGDVAVLRDAASPSGWRFRTSYHEATQAVVRAYQLLPSVHRALEARSFASVRALLWTRSNLRRQGSGLPADTTTFYAYPEWRAETLAFIPYPAGSVRVPPTLDLAVRHGRQLFHDIALAWATAYPASAEAMEALALSLEMLRDPAALDTIRRARALATTPVAAVRAAAAEVWMTVRLSVPANLERLRDARALADSVIRRYPPPTAPEPLLLASLATLTGRATLGAAYVRQTTIRDEWSIPAPLAHSAPALLLFAALGGPRDSLIALERAVASAVERDFPAAERRAVRAEWLGRAASLAFPQVRLAALGALVGHGDYLVDAQASWVRGDSSAVRRMFAARREARRTMAPEDITLDGLYPEAALLAEIGDTVGAIAWLDPTLAALAATAPQLYAEPAIAGALVRAMVLRADLAKGVGDAAGAMQWGRAADVLWSEADPFLRRTGSVGQ